MVSLEILMFAKLRKIPSSHHLEARVQNLVSAECGCPTIVTSHLFYVYNNLILKGDVAIERRLQLAKIQSLYCSGCDSCVLVCVAWAHELVIDMALHTGACSVLCFSVDKLNDGMAR